MTFPHFNRRLHLYLGLALLPWFLMYGVSSLPFAHNQFFNDLDAAKNVPLWTVRSEHPFDKPVPEEQEALREFGREVLRAAGIETRTFYAYRQSPNVLNVGANSFLHATRILYTIDQKKLTVEDRRFRFDQFLTGMHARGGFEQDGALSDSWGIVVDIVCAGMVVWIASGLYMWWGLSGHRRWGWLAILAGAGSFALFTLRL